MRRVLILGCGYTGRRLAWLLLQKGVPLTVTTRKPKIMDALAAAGANVLQLDVSCLTSIGSLREAMPADALVVHSIPLISTECGLADPTPLLLDAIDGRHARMVYLSTTAVYGAIRDVDERTPAAPRSGRERLRLSAEQAVAGGSHSSLILRPAAIYGPGRGVQVSLPAGRYSLRGHGDNFVSRIHVCDLAAICEAALFSDLTGAYPVADDEPCTSREIAEFCARLLGIPMPPKASLTEPGETRRADRRVDGSAIRRALGVTLRYPSYRVGIPASLSGDSL